MATKRINISLSQKSIQDAISYLKNYKNDLVTKTSEFTQKLAEIGIPIIEENMRDASFTFDEKNIRSGSDTTHQTFIKMRNFGNYSESVLTIQGKEVLFIEFGAGVYYNGDAGQSPHPKGEEFGYVIGSYGNGNGQRKVWAYFDENGDKIVTHGVQATMPLLKAEQEIIKQYVNVARSVFR